MSVATAHVLHGINTPTQFLSQIEEATPSPIAQALARLAAGYHEPLFQGILGMRPEIPFRTTQLATLLALTGVTGADLSGGNTDLYYRYVTPYGTPALSASALHTRLRLTKSVLVWNSITARHQGEASADCRLVGIYDGTNVPLAVTGTTALVGTPSAAEYFGLGPVSINGSALTGIEEATIESGVDLLIAGSASEAWPTFVGVRAVNPSVVLRGSNLGPWASYGPVGLGLYSTGLVLYLRRVNADAGYGLCYQADATAGHIKVSGANGLVTVEQTSGGGNSEARTQLRVRLRAASATTAALTIATGQQIT